MVEVRLHAFFFAEDGQSFTQDSCSTRMRWRDDPVVHPFPFASCNNDAGSPQIGQMPRDLGLALPEDFDEIADADFSAIHQVEKPEAGAVRKGRKQQ